MRLSDLLGAEVLDGRGRSAGKVYDVRLVQQGRILGTFGAALEVAGLLVGHHPIGARLGYERTEMRGPLLLKLLFRWLQRDGRYVPWDRIRSIEPQRIRIHGDVGDLRPPGASD
jgi:hypothetical protein